MAYCTLGNYTFRIAPSSVVFPFSVDSTVIPTVGGRVVQVYGVTLGDMVVQGLFGQERFNSARDSWQLAESFQQAISAMVAQQSKQPSTSQLARINKAEMHKPFRFVFNDDSPERRAAKLPIHKWDFQVYIKSLEDSTDGGYTVAHETGKFSYGYTLTLFIVEDNSRNLRQVAVDKFINRLAAGVGWKRTEYNGPMTKDELENYIKANSPDGTIHGLVLKQFQDAANGQGLPGAAAVAQSATALGASTLGNASAGAAGTGTTGAAAR